MDKQTTLLTPKDRVNDAIKAQHAQIINTNEDLRKGILKKSDVQKLKLQLHALMRCELYFTTHSSATKLTINAFINAFEGKIAKYDTKDNYNNWYSHSGNPNAPHLTNYNRFKNELGIKELQQQIKFHKLLLTFID